ncbi:MAG: nucleotidyltransferase family protein [Candidatus Zipacnadales bacterium]
MNALALAAGYGTRMASVAKGRPKPLLEVGGQAVIEYLFDQLSTLNEVHRTVVITNDLYITQFLQWSESIGCSDVEIISDGTRSNEERLGAIGDLEFAIRRAGLENDDLLVAGADNIFRFPLQLLVDYFEEKCADVIAVVRESHRERLQHTSTLRLAPDGRVIAFAEKAPQPLSELICPPLYILRRQTLPLVKRYLNTGGSADAPGHFIAWLHRQVPVYGKLMPEGRHDIGNPETYQEARKALED